MPELSPGKQKDPSVVLNLTLFVFATCIGYLLFGTFLKNVPAEVLLFVTFFCLFITRTFVGKKPFQRSPFSSNPLSFDRYDVTYALMLFAYWFLFWFGVKALPQDSNAAAVAISFLALNVVATPLATQKAHGNSLTFKSIAPTILLGGFLIFCVALTHIKVTAKDIYVWFQYIETIMGSTEEPLTLSDNYVALKKLEYNFQIIIGVFCLMLAVVCEAFADYYHIKRKYIANHEAGFLFNSIDYNNYAFRETVKFVRSHSIDGLLDIVEAELLRDLKISQEHLNRISKVMINKPTTAAEANKKLSSDMQKEINKINLELEKLSELKTQFNDSSFDNSLQIENNIRKEIHKNFLEEIYKAVERIHSKKISRSVENDAAGRMDDVLAILGTFISFLILIGLSRDLPSISYDHLIGTVILLLVMGFTGSIARILFVAPLLEHDEKNNKLVPPVYAVRPLAFVITYISFAWFVGQDSGVLLGIFPYELSAKPPTNIGWVIGIFGAVIVAVFQFIKLRR